MTGGPEGAGMPDTIPPSLLVFDDEHHRALYVEGRIVGWTGTRAQYHWQIMAAPIVSREQLFLMESTPLAEYDPYPYRGDATAALRRHAECHRLEMVDRADTIQQFEARYSDALEQEIHELQARCRHIRLGRKTSDLLDRLQTYETALTQLRALLEGHFTSHQAEWVQIQSLLTCIETDPPKSP
jgi:hypothetical protein